MRKTKTIAVACVAALLLWALPSGYANPEPTKPISSELVEGADTIPVDADEVIAYVRQEMEKEKEKEKKNKNKKEKVQAPQDTLTGTVALILAYEDMLDLLSLDKLLDMIDYYEADSIRPTPNRLDGISRLTRLNADFAEMEVTEASRFQARVLPLKKRAKWGDQVMLFAYTVGNDEIAPDTRLAFHNMSGPVPGDSYFTPPTARDFFAIPKGDKTKMEDLLELLPFEAVEYTLSADDNTLRARLTSPMLVGLESRPLIEKYLVPELTYDWNGKRFVKKN